MRWIAYGSFSGSFAIFFWFSDCTPNHPFVDPAPAYEESPDWLSALNCRSTTVLRAMVRLNHTYVIVRWQSQTPRSSGHTQTEPSAQGPLHGRDQMQSEFAIALFHGFRVLPISNIVELLQGCSLCLKEGNREEEPVL